MARGATGPPDFPRFSKVVVRAYAEGTQEHLVLRAAQNFKHEKFIWDLTDSGSLGSKHYKIAKILKFRQYLDIAKCDQRFTT